MSFDVLAELEAHGTERFTPEEAYAWCRTFTKQRASNFYYASTILPPRKRNAIYAAYAFSGYVDDIADELTDRSRQEEEIARARERLKACYEGARQGPLFIALGDAIDRFGTPREHFEELVNGVEMDFTINRYGTWADLQQYCYRVASMVGHICVSIFGAKPHPRAEEFATSMGLGLQIVNIMRDVKEDAGRGRVYFPEDELERARPYARRHPRLPVRRAIRLADGRAGRTRPITTSASDAGCCRCSICARGCA